MSTATAPAVKTTNIVGYFNPNDWPISIHSSALGINNLTIPKGAYVLDSEGNKVNDPRLNVSGYVGPSMLATELSDVPVPVREIVPPSARHTTMESPGFTSSPKVPASMRPPAMAQTSRVAAARAAMKLPPKPAPVAVPPAPPQPPRQMTSVTTPESAPATHNPVVAMSMAEARRRGLVAGVVTPAPEGVPDNDSKEVAKVAPFIGYARDGSLRGKPGTRPAPVVPVPAAPATTTTIVGGDSAPQTPQTLSPVKGGIAESMAEEAQHLDPDALDVVGQVLHTVVATTAAPPPAATAAALSGELPEPRLGGPTEVFKRTPDGKFECDGRTFKSYAGFLGYMRVKHPDQLELVKRAKAAIGS